MHWSVLIFAFEVGEEFWHLLVSCYAGMKWDGLWIFEISEGFGRLTIIIAFSAVRLFYIFFLHPRHYIHASSLNIPFLIHTIGILAVSLPVLLFCFVVMVDHLKEFGGTLFLFYTCIDHLVIGLFFFSILQHSFVHPVRNN